MRFVNEYSGKGNRPYPIDRERRRRVLYELDELKMNISTLARKLKMPVSLVSMIINGRRLSLKTERRIAKYLGKPVNYLFPRRSGEELAKMRQAENAQRTVRKRKAA